MDTNQNQMSKSDRAKLAAFWKQQYYQVISKVADEILARSVRLSVDGKRD